jgi:hypothetical protein
VDNEAADPRLELVYQEALRGISEQQAVLESLRSRTGTLLAAASISTSFLGGIAIEGHHSVPSIIADVVAVLAFIVLGILIVLILLPRGQWRFRFDVETLLTGYVEAWPPASLDVMRKELARRLQANRRANETRLIRLFGYFRWASALLTIQVVGWVVGIAWR